MGRKIPARKHFGIRDPIKQHEQRLALIKDKINNPPEKRDFQKVSHSLARFIKLKEDAKSQTTKPTQKKQLKRLTNQNEDTERKNFPKKFKKKPTPQSKTDDEPENFRQRANESDNKFMRRVNRITQETVEEAKFEAKYGVSVIRNAKTGEIKLKKKPTNEIDERLKQNAANLKKNGKNTKAIVIPADERKKLVKAMMKEKKENEAVDKKPFIEEYKRDEIRFGEVVQAPPQLPVPRLAKKAETVPRPGKKQLLLRSIIENHPNRDEEATKPSSVTQKAITHKPKDVSLKGKRKDLSMSMRKMIETEQSLFYLSMTSITKNTKNRFNLNITMLW